MRDHIKEVNLLFLFTFIFSRVASNLFYFLNIQDPKYLLVLSQLIYLFPSVLYIVYYRINIKEFIRIKRISFSNIILLILFSYLVMPLMNLLSMITILFSKNHISGVVTEITENNNIWIGIIVVAFIPCILEEIVYRGVFYNEYQKVNIKKGILLSGFLFGLMHINFNQFLYAFIVGSIFALVVEATDSILASILIHFVINGTSVVSSYFILKLYKAIGILKNNNYSQEVSSMLEESYSKSELITSIQVQFFIAIITTILAVLVYITIAKNANRYEVVKSIFKKSAKHEEDKKFITIPLVLGIFGCVLIMIVREFV